MLGSLSEPSILPLKTITFVTPLARLMQDAKLWAVSAFMPVATAWFTFALMIALNYKVN